MQFSGHQCLPLLKLCIRALLRQIDQYFRQFVLDCQIRADRHCFLTLLEERGELVPGHALGRSLSAVLACDYPL